MPRVYGQVRLSTISFVCCYSTIRVTASHCTRNTQDKEAPAAASLVARLSATRNEAANRAPSFTLRHGGESIRIISARDMHRKERAIYEQASKDNS